MLFVCFGLTISSDFYVRTINGHDLKHLKRSSSTDFENFVDSANYVGFRVPA